MYVHRKYVQKHSAHTERGHFSFYCVYGSHCWIAFRAPHGALPLCFKRLMGGSGWGKWLAEKRATLFNLNAPPEFQKAKDHDSRDGE